MLVCPTELRFVCWMFLCGEDVTEASRVSGTSFVYEALTEICDNAPGKQHI